MLSIHRSNEWAALTKIVIKFSAKLFIGMSAVDAYSAVHFDLVCIAFIIEYSKYVRLELRVVGYLSIYMLRFNFIAEIIAAQYQATKCLSVMKHLIM